ncbi:hypothetical protein [Microcystis phage Mel-JY33]
MLDDMTPLTEEERRVALRAVSAIYRDAVAHALREDSYARLHDAAGIGNVHPIGWLMSGWAVGVACGLTMALLLSA